MILGWSKKTLNDALIENSTEEAQNLINKAEEKFDQLIRLGKFINDKNLQSVGLGNIGLIYIAKGEPDKALKYHQDALKIDKEISYRRGQASDLGNIGLIYVYKGNKPKQN